MKIYRLLAVLIIIAQATVLAQNAAPSANDQFKQALNLLETADSARDMGDLATAADLYREALDRYIGLSHRYPEWKSKIVKFRINYCNQQLEAIMRKLDKGSLKSQQLSEPEQLLPDIPYNAGHESKQDSRVDFIRRAAALFLREDKPREARDVLLEGLRSSPDDPHIRLLLAIAQCRMGRHQDAIFLMRELIQESPQNAVAHLIYGVALAGTGETAAAEQQLQEALNLSPNLIEAHLNLAQLMLARDIPDRQSAKQHYANARRLGAARNKKLESRLDL